MNFFVSAHTLIEQAIKAAEEGHYPSAWQKTFKARVYFAADAISQVVQLSLTFIKAFFASLEALYTWGYERETFDQEIENFGEKAHRLTLSLFGAVISPTYAFWWKEKKLLEEVWEIFQRILPNRLTLSPRGASLGWACKSVAKDLTRNSPNC